MNDTPLVEPRKPNSSRREFVLKAGVRFGLLLGGLYLGRGIIREPAGYFPLLPVTGRVAFNWGYGLIVSPLIWFGFGCLFGLVMWRFVKNIPKGKQPETN